MVLQQYLPILLFCIIGLIVGVAPVILGGLLRPFAPNPEKNDSYECGFASFSQARMPFNVRFYLIALLFIVFDLEIAFLIPWAVVMKKVGWQAFWAIMSFLGLLTVGFIYEWKKGVLEWE